jgi:hypothetical protein
MWGKFESCRLRKHIGNVPHDLPAVVRRRIMLHHAHGRFKGETIQCRPT